MTLADGQSPVHLARGTLRCLQQGVAEHETRSSSPPYALRKGESTFRVVDA